jgi:branched-chain amino acid transport system ATP-binding protein
VTLEVTGLHVGYAGAQVLRGIDLTVSADETVALLGRNGMGKTTLVRSICGLHPPVTTAGTIAYDGVDITKRSSFQINRAGIAIIPQGRRIFGSLTVLEHLSAVRKRKPTTGDPWTVERLFDFFPRLAERQKSFAKSLSGGEQQMLAIGRALMTNPSLLVMDEPSEGLAPTVLDVIQDRIAGLRGTGLSVLIAEQNVDLALDMADRIVIIDGGEIPWTGTPAELRGDPTTLERYLGV